MPILSFMSTLTRDRRPELMDSPGLDERRHRRALDALGRINRVSRSAGQLWSEIARRGAIPAEGTLRVLDLACGGGDVALALEARAWQRGVEAQIEGCDLSLLAVARAREAAARRRSGARFFRADVLRDSVPSGFDVIYCTLFLHHLDEEDAADLLRRMAAAARRMIVVQDLERGFSGFLLAWMGTRLLTRSDVARIDGPLSVRAAFTRDEALALADRAGLDAEVRRCWPCRFSLSWSRSRAAS
jgi:SAM-dependent methyltransferase